MSDTPPIWHKLISAWIARSRYGLTIPFLIGARSVLAGVPAFSKVDIEALFKEIIQQPVSNHIVYPRWCEDMAAVVLTSYPEDFLLRPRYNLIEFRSQVNERTSMAVEKSLAAALGVKATPSEVLEALISHALPFVEQGNYSRFWTIEGRQDGPLQADDLAFIRAVIAEYSA